MPRVKTNVLKGVSKRAAIKTISLADKAAMEEVRLRVGCSGFEIVGWGSGVWVRGSVVRKMPRVRARVTV